MRIAEPRSAPGTAAAKAMAASVTTPRPVTHEWPRCLDRNHTSTGNDVCES